MSDCTEQGAAQAEGQKNMPGQHGMSDCTERGAAQAEGQKNMPGQHGMSDCTERGAAQAQGRKNMPSRLGMSSALVTALFDDAALFPPGNAAMPDAVRRHRQDQELWYAGSVGPFVCPDARLLELDRALGAAGVDRLDVALTVPGGPQALTSALDAARETPRVRVVAVEVPLGSAPVASVREALDGGDPAIVGYVEVPAAELSTDLATRLRTAGLRLKLRTGGTSAAAFPTEDDLARALTCAAGQGLPIKCTAGLHHAVRHRDPATGFEHHGFLNVMLAVHAALTAADARAALAEQDSGAVAAAIRALSAEQIAAIRDIFRSFGTCGIDEPLVDLVKLDLLEMAP
jgi:hypothetical protein